MSNNDLIKIDGLIIGESDYKEYDKLLTILTPDLGKIRAYAFGVRKPNSKNIGKMRLFTFSSFELNKKGEYYSIIASNLINSFDNLSKDYEKVCYASYFVELANFFGFENLESQDMCRLMYYTFFALDKGRVEKNLIRRIFELKMLQYNGIYKEADKLLSNNETLKYAWNFILSNDDAKMYSFNLKNCLMELFNAEMNIEMREKVGKTFKSLSILDE